MVDTTLAEFATADPFRLAVEAAPTGMLMVDGEGSIVLVNAHIETLFGYTRVELLGKPLEMLLPERFRGRHPAFRSGFMQESAPRPMGVGRDLYGLRKDGTEIRIEIGLNPLTMAGRPYVLSSVADVTERARADAERQLLLERLKGLNHELTRALHEREVLLQEVHHRVKNNLQVISSLLSLQVRKLGGGVGTEALEECRARVRAIGLIHERLYQSKDYAAVDFTSYVRGLATIIFDTMEVSPATVKLALELEDVSLGVDRAIPCSLLVNELLTNALKHGFPDGRRGTVTVELGRLENSRIRLRIADDGVGGGAREQASNVGSLGLTLVHTLARQLEASVEVDDTNGTAFTFTFAHEAA